VIRKRHHWQSKCGLQDSPITTGRRRRLAMRFSKAADSTCQAVAMVFEEASSNKNF
jgi:hypothetical protein